MKSETELTYQPTLKLYVGKPFNFDSPTMLLIIPNVQFCMTNLPLVSSPVCLIS